jgi:Fic family protein
MSTVIRRRWISEHSGPSRKDNRGCEYEAFVPDHLVGRSFTLEGDVAADITDAEAAIARMNVEATSLVDTEALARILLRAEAVASSRIEGLEVGARRLLLAEVVRGMDEKASDVTAAEVLNNIDAMVFAVESVAAGDPITVDLLLETHRRILGGTRLEK